MRVPEQHYNNGQSHAYFGRCYYHYKKYKQLAFAAHGAVARASRQVVHFRKSNQQQVYGVQHQLYAHKYNDHVAAGKHPDNAYDEQGQRKKNVIIYWHGGKAVLLLNSEQKRTGVRRNRSLIAALQPATRSSLL
jgi:hypothetical protein